MNPQDTHSYDDIIHLPHPVSKKHPRMSPLNRAAQFSPFAALTGHEDAIQETARLTDSYVDLEEDWKELLDEQLQQLKKNLAQRPACEVTYFQPDRKKDGGSYVTVRRNVKKIEEHSRRIVFTDGTDLPIEQIFSIRGDL